MPAKIANFSYTSTISTSKTRPNDTTTYTAGDVVNEDASAGTNWTFANAMLTNGGSGLLTRVRIEDSANQTLKGSFELWLFSTAPTADFDNAAFTPTDTELNNLVAVVPVSTAYVGDASVGASGNCVLMSDQVAIPLRSATATRDLYGVLVVRNAYVPVANEVFRISLTVLQDKPS